MANVNVFNNLHIDSGRGRHIYNIMRITDICTDTQPFTYRFRPRPIYIYIDNVYNLHQYKFDLSAAFEASSNSYTFEYAVCTMQRGRGRHGGQQRPGPYDRVHEGRGRGGKGKGKGEGKDVSLQTLEIVNEPWRLIDAAAAEQTLDVCSRGLSGAAADTLQASISMSCSAAFQSRTRWSGHAPWVT